VGHCPSFTGVVRFVLYRQDVVTCGWLELEVEICFPDVSFEGVDGLEGCAGVKGEAVGAVANDGAFPYHQLLHFFHFAFLVG